MSTTIEPTVCDAETKLHLLLCLGADFDLAYIAHLCRHYAPVIDSWLVLLHSNEMGGNGERAIAEAGRIFESGLGSVSSKAALFTRVWRGEFNGVAKVERLNDMVQEFVPPGEWVVHVDADEFIDCPQELKSLVAQCNISQRKVMYGNMVDRFAEGKKPHPIEDTDDLFSKFPHSGEYTKTVMKACTYRPCLMKYEAVPLLTGCHEYSGQNCPDYLHSGQPIPTIWHFKWVESTREKLKYRIDSFKRQGLEWWKESAVCLKDIYQEDSPEHHTAASTEKSHPYSVLDARAFWKTSIAEGTFADTWRPHRLGTIQERNADQVMIRLNAGGVQLNPTAALIWERCNGTHTVAEILADLCELFGMPEEQLRDDLRNALNGLISVDALESEYEPSFKPPAESSQSLRLHLGLVSETSEAFLNQVKLCLYSLRKNGGALSDLPVTLITNSEPLNTRDARFLKKHFSPIEFKTSPRLGAIPHTSKLNVFYSIDPSDYDVLIFMDCDTVVRKPLDDMVDHIANGVAEFVCRRGGETDRNRFVDFNALVSRFCGTGPKGKVIYEEQEEWPMFNSGVFLATSEAVCRIRKYSVEFTYHLFNAWQRNNALEMLPGDIRQQIKIDQPVRESWPIEQGALALACINTAVKVQYLEDRYNSWGGDRDFHILHCFKSLYQFDRSSMFSAGSEEWLAEYLESDVPGKVFLAGIVRQYKQAFHPEISGKDS